ncbi:hypothetical protein QYF36_014783 [Acer negundo]|nr:hypothetical protein QYF36_014783 [Acer negundo]
MLGHLTKECPDKPINMEAIREEFLFVFWICALASPKRIGYGGRKWISDGRGDGSTSKGSDILGSNVHVPLSGALMVSNSRVGPIKQSGPLMVENSGNGGVGLSNKQMGPSILGMYPLEHANIIRASIQSQSHLSQISSQLKETQHMVFGAKKSLMENENPNLSVIWKRRARNQHRLREQKNEGSVLGKKKNVSGNRCISDGQKRQRCVSSIDDSTNTGCVKGSAA